MSRRASELVSGATAPKPKKTIGKIKVQGTYTFLVLYNCNPISSLSYRLQATYLLQ